VQFIPECNRDRNTNILIAVYDIPKLAVKIKVAPNPFVANSVFIPV